ncbi:solute carrier family 13 member 1 [Anarrhichthys ocellatus]|uniref:solute carrier family 13 member 1 n=1 Tax=Anarrhichthys ocellatus TaxID=433405 RepID=UPI0012EDEA2A|nr:solute carrier family 13 member 1 [Anarrhichthys ocellatus]XP_031724057.1 solute carrier family 13 member 1 [Anarrhichthys ocellatus]
MISWQEFQASMLWRVALLVGGGFALAEGTKAEAIHVNPLYVLIPTTLCTSFSFLLPVSNPPNAVVFAYGHISIVDMVKAGLGVNVIGVLL